MTCRSDMRRRWFGAFFLLCATTLLIWGQTALSPYLKGWGFVIYWLVCFGFTFLALLTALIDVWVLRQRTRDQQRELFNRTFDHSAGPPDKTRS